MPKFFCLKAGQGGGVRKLYLTPPFPKEGWGGTNRIKPTKRAPYFSPLRKGGVGGVTDGIWPTKKGQETACLLSLDPALPTHAPVVTPLTPPCEGGEKFKFRSLCHSLRRGEKFKFRMLFRACEGLAKGGERAKLRRASSPPLVSCGPLLRHDPGLRWRRRLVARRRLARIWVLQIERLFARFACAGIALRITDRRLRCWVEAIVARQYEWPGGPQALLDEYQPVRFQDRACLAFQVGERDVVAENRSRFRSDSRAPIVEGLQHVQINIAVDPELLDLHLQIVECRSTTFFVSQILFVVVGQVLNRL